MSSPFNIAVSCTTDPSASQTVAVIDSTYGLIAGSQASMDASTGTYLTPGPYRAQWPHAILRGTCRCAAQALTLIFELRTGHANTSADWETDTSVTVAAGATQPFEFKARTADWRLRYTAGGTPPTAGSITVALQAVGPTKDYGA